MSIRRTMLYSGRAAWNYRYQNQPYNSCTKGWGGPWRGNNAKDVCGAEERRMYDGGRFCAIL